MSLPVQTNDKGIPSVSHSDSPSYQTIKASDIKTVKVSNISVAVSDRDIREFFSFSGDIQYVEMQRESETTRVAYVTFKDSQGADTAILLSGAKIADLSVTITPDEDYQLPPEALPSNPEEKLVIPDYAVQKAEDVVSTMLAKGFILGKDAFNKAKAFDEQHQLSTNASATVASLDHRMGFSDKLSIGTAIVNEKVREMDERYQVSEKARSAFAIAEQKASTAGSAIMSNQYVLTGASWVSSAMNAVAKAAGNVSLMTKEKVEKAEDEKREMLYRERREIIDEFAYTHLDDSPAGEPAIVPVSSADDNQHGIV